MSCGAAIDLHNKYAFPDVPQFLRMFLLSRSSTELYSIVQDFEALMSTSRRTLHSGRELMIIIPRIIPATPPTILIRFDGSF